MLRVKVPVSECIDEVLEYISTIESEEGSWQSVCESLKKLKNKVLKEEEYRKNQGTWFNYIDFLNYTPEEEMKKYTIMMTNGMKELTNSFIYLADTCCNVRVFKDLVTRFGSKNMFKEMNQENKERLLLALVQRAPGMNWKEMENNEEYMTKMAWDCCMSIDGDYNYTGGDYTVETVEWSDAEGGYFEDDSYNPDKNEPWRGWHRYENVMDVLNFVLEKGMMEDFDGTQEFCQKMIREFNADTHLRKIEQLLTKRDEGTYCDRFGAYEQHTETMMELLLPHLDIHKLLKAINDDVHLKWDKLNYTYMVLKYGDVTSWNNKISE